MQRRCWHLNASNEHGLQSAYIDAVASGRIALRHSRLMALGARLNIAISSVIYSADLARTPELTALVLIGVSRSALEMPPNKSLERTREG